jgi:sarcosine oxidase subunit gamma
MLDAAQPSLSPTASVHLPAPRTLLSLAAYKGQRAALSEALGVALPTTPRRIVHNGTAYLWTGPDSWLAISETPALDLSAAAPHAALTDQSDGHILLRVTGAHPRAILAKLVPLDLDPRAFPEDAVALTLAAQIGVKLWREGEDFLLACFRSFAGALHHALLEAEAEFAPLRGRG